MSFVALHGLSPDRVGERAPGVPDDGFWAYCGGNSGNLVYRYSIHRELLDGRRATSVAAGVDVFRDPTVSSQILASDAVVVPMANLLRDVTTMKLGQKELEETRFVTSLAWSLRSAGKALMLVSLGY
jgi:hypothetical protein